MNNKKSIIRKIKEYAALRKLNKNRDQRKSFARRIFSMLNRYVMIFAGIILLYLLLLFMLVIVEREAKGATIHNMGQAIWYSLATFTTVGYGDLCPVTPMGRGIASIFLILGVGLLGFFVGFMVEFIARIRPIAILSLKADKPWYIFTGMSSHAMMFAENLKSVRPDAMMIYAETKDDDKTSKDIFVSWTVRELLERRGSLYDAHVICMKDNEMENFLDAVELAALDVPVICLANFTPAHHPMNINFFSLMDCTARVFWQQYPVRHRHETIVIIGFGKAGCMMLDRALELNVLYEDQNIVYHVFGGGKEYRRNRKLLGDIVTLNAVSDEGDCVIFHDDLWNSDEELLMNADRIVLCDDVEAENIEILHTIQKFFAIKGELYIYNSNVRSVATSFGRARDILTPAFVLHNRLSDMALCRHELFRFYFNGDVPMWEDLNSLVKDLNYIATDHISMKVRMMLGDEAPASPFDELEPEILRRASAEYNGIQGERKEIIRKIEHERNLRFYKLHNYRYGETLDDEARINPLVKPYEQLDDSEKGLVDTAWALLDELASHKEARRR